MDIAIVAITIIAAVAVTIGAGVLIYLMFFRGRSSMSASKQEEQLYNDPRYNDQGYRTVPPAGAYQPPPQQQYQPPPPYQQQSYAQNNYPSYGSNCCTTKDWILWIFLLSIPLVGFILMIVWGFGRTQDCRAKYCKAYLIWYLILIALVVLLGIIIPASCSVWWMANS